MQISRTMLRLYLDQVTHGYFASHEEMPADLAEFDPYMQTAWHMAKAAGDLPWLQLGLRHLSNDPQADCSRFRGPFPLHDEDIRLLILHFLERMQAGCDPPVLPISLVDMTGDEWRAHRAKLG